MPHPPTKKKKKLSVWIRSTLTNINATKLRGVQALALQIMTGAMPSSPKMTGAMPCNPKKTEKTSPKFEICCSLRPLVFSVFFCICLFFVVLFSVFSVFFRSQLRQEISAIQKSCQQ